MEDLTNFTVEYSMVFEVDHEPFSFISNFDDDKYEGITDGDSYLHFRLNELEGVMVAVEISAFGYDYQLLSEVSDLSFGSFDYVDGYYYERVNWWL